MKQQRKTEIKVGLTVLFGIIVFIWILGWAKNVSISSTDIELKVKFENASGLQVGSEVSVNGVKAGVVKDIYVESYYVVVEITVNNDAQLKSDAEFSLQVTDLMGGKKIDISPGKDSVPLNPDELQVGIFQADLASMMEVLSGIEIDLNTILNDVKITLSEINSFLTDKQLKEDIRTSIAGLSTLATRLNNMLTENQENIRTITQNTKEITEDTKKLISSNQESINSSINSLNSILQSSDSLVTKLNYLADETLSGDNNIGKLLYDDSLFISLTKTLEQTKELTKVMLDQLTNDGVKIDATIF
ncbi:MAG: ABC transporter substrate-binding protein [Ignavibacteriae bacterium]|nr:MAG: ABC transporter substrate-binding protein [Ignavibacteriota bacterium]